MIYDSKNGVIWDTELLLYEQRSETLKLVSRTMNKGPVNEIIELIANEFYRRLRQVYKMGDYLLHMQYINNELPNSEE